ncbi:MAG: hypothetical protein LBH66_00685 [Oscillospiraceae bacterium]|nr:hypothetical protein [Oscillospiraceae bacterium]
MLKKIGSMPQKTAAILMSLMIAGGVIGGNRNALSEAREPVASQVAMMCDRLSIMVSKANNYTVMANAQGADISSVARAQTRAMEVISMRGVDNSSAQEVYTAANQLHQAVMDLNDRLESPDKGTVYDDWMLNRVNYKDADSYNATLEGYNRVYRALPTRWLWGVAYRPISY